MKNIYLAVARYLAPILASDPEVRLVIVTEVARQILTSNAPVTLTDAEKLAIDQVKAELEAEG